MENLKTKFTDSFKWNVDSRSFLLTGILTYLTIYLMYPSLSSSAYSDIFLVISELGVPPFIKEIFSLIITVVLVNLSIILLILIILVDSLILLLNGDLNLITAFTNISGAVFMAIFILSLLYLTDSLFNEYFLDDNGKEEQGITEIETTTEIENEMEL